MPDKTLENVPGMRDAALVPAFQAETLSEDYFFSTHVNRSSPCVIRNAVGHWPAAQKWRDHEYLKKRAGHHRVYFNPNEYHISADKMRTSRTELSFAEAIDRLSAQETSVAIVVTALPSELLADLGNFWFLPKVESPLIYTPVRYFFFRNAGTTWHYHPFDESLMCQVIGSKTIGLMNGDNPFHHSLRTIFFKEDYYNDPSAFDGFDCAHVSWFSATLHEGDALYIPPLWWHGVVPLTTTLGATATIAWRSPLHVIARGIIKMANGEIDFIGKTATHNLPALGDIARKLGLTRELELLWRRGI